MSPAEYLINTTPSVDWQNCSDLKCYMVLSDTEKTAIGIICYLAGPITFLENMLVLTLIVATPNLRRRPSFIFIGSLALADVFASCFYTINFLNFHLYHHQDGQHAYLFKLGGVTLSFTGSVGSLLLTALDRYICIHRASQYKRVLTRQWALIGLAVLWTSTALIAFLPLLGWDCSTQLAPPCSRLFPYINQLYMTTWTGFILVVLALILGAYGLILWRAHQHETSMAGLQAAPGGQARMRMDIRLARTLSLILLILVSCWLPVLSFILVDVSLELSLEQQRAFAFCSTLCLVNSAVNPLLYALRCRELREALIQLLSLGCQGARRCIHGGTGDGNAQRAASRSNDNLASEGEGSASLLERLDKQKLEVIRM